MLHNNNIADNPINNLSDADLTMVLDNEPPVAKNAVSSKLLQSIGDTIADGLDLVEKTAKAIGQEAKGLGLVSNFAEIGNAILQDPSQDKMERVACGTATGLAQIGLNAAITAGVTATGSIATPYAGAVMGIAAQPLIQKVVQPYGRVASEKCHDFFTWLREPKKSNDHEAMEALLKKENPILLDYFQQEKRREQRHEENAEMELDLPNDRVEKQSFSKNIYDTLSTYINIIPSAKAATLDAPENQSAKEIASQIDKNTNIAFNALIRPRQHALSWLNAHAAEINKGQFEQSQIDTCIQKIAKREELTTEQSEIYAFAFTKTLAHHLEIKNDNIVVDAVKIGKAVKKIKATKNSVKDEINAVQEKLLTHSLQLEKPVHELIQKQTNAAKDRFQQYVPAQRLAKSIMKQSTTSKNLIDPMILKNMENLLVCARGTELVGSGLAVVGRLCHNKQLVQLGQATTGVSSIMKGLIPMMTSGFKSGFSFGSVGLILGGINTVLGCFDRSDNQLGEALQAIMQQLQFISRQIFDLHQDMREQFDRVFKVLDKIHSDMLKHFMELHRETRDIKRKLIEIQESLHDIRGGIATADRKIVEADRRNQTFHYTHLDAEWVKATEQCKKQLEYGKVDLKSLKEQHSSLLAALNTTNKLKAQTRRSNKHFDEMVVHSLNQTLANAEENYGLLFSYFYQDKSEEITHEPYALAETISQLIALFHSFEQSKEYKAMPEPIFNDYQELAKTGKKIIQYIDDICKPNFIQSLFANYKNNLASVMQVIQIIKTMKEIELNDSRFQKISHQLEKQYNDFINQSLDQIAINIIPDWYTKSSYGLKRTVYRGDEGQSAYTARIYAKSHEDDYLTKRKNNIIEKFNEIKTNLSKLVINEDDIYISYDQGVSIKNTQSLCTIIKPVPNQLATIILPLHSNTMTVPQEYYEAHVLGLGELSYFYEINHDQTVLKVSAIFKYKENPVIIKTWDLSLENGNQQLDNSPIYNKSLSPNEALWNYWVGGHFAATNQSVYLVTNHGQDECPGTYDYFCRQPALVERKGYYNCSSPCLFISHTHNDQFRIAIKNEIDNLNQKLNDYLFDQSTSSYPNKLMVALRKLDLSAKLLYGYLVLAFNKTMSKDKFLSEMSALFNKNKIDDFLKNNDSLQDQLQVNHELLTKLEEYFIEYSQETTIEDEYFELVGQIDTLQRLVFAHEGQTITWEEAENHIYFNSESYSEGLEVGKKLAMSTIIMALNAAKFKDAADLLGETINGELMEMDEQAINPALKQGFVQALSLEVHNATAVLLNSKQIKAACWLLQFSHDELWKLTNQHLAQPLSLTSFAENDRDDERPEKRRKTGGSSSLGIFSNHNNQANNNVGMQQRLGLGKRSEMN